MSIPQKIYQQIQGFSFADRAVILALVTEYLEKGSISYSQEGFSLDFFNSVRKELDRVIRRRAYARQYRAKKKAEKTEAAESSKSSKSVSSLPSDSSENSEKPDASTIERPYFNRRERRLLERQLFKRPGMLKKYAIPPQSNLRQNI